MDELERFIIGQGESGRLYLTHTREPRFVGELLDEEDHAIAEGGVTMSLPASGELLARIMWIDDPAGCDLHRLRREIEDAIEEIDFRSERDVDAHLRTEDGD